MKQLLKPQAAWLIVLLFVLPLFAFYKANVYPTLPYRLVPDFLQLPQGMNFGEVSSVAVNTKGHVFVFHRGNQPLLEFDNKGRFVAALGGDGLFKTAHGIKIDPQDNIWVTDVASNLVLKLDPKGHVRMVLGKNNTAGEWSEGLNIALFNKPTDVAFGKNGEIYVADGYGNSRIVMFDSEGKFIKAWGKKGTGNGEFNTPHALAIDAKGQVYVADRENRRVQVFDATGNFIKAWTEVGKPFGLCITPDQSIYISDAEADRILQVDTDGKVLGAFGSPGKAPGQLGLAHGLTVTNKGEIYVAEIVNWRVQKFVKK